MFTTPQSLFAYPNNPTSLNLTQISSNWPSTIPAQCGSLVCQVNDVTGAPLANPSYSALTNKVSFNYDPLLNAVPSSTAKLICSLSNFTSTFNSSSVFTYGDCSSPSISFSIPTIINDMSLSSFYGTPVDLTSILNKINTSISYNLQSQCASGPLSFTYIV